MQHRLVSALMVAVDLCVAQGTFRSPGVGGPLRLPFCSTLKDFPCL